MELKLQLHAGHGSRLRFAQETISYFCMHDHMQCLSLVEEYNPF